MIGSLSSLITTRSFESGVLEEGGSGSPGPGLRNTALHHCFTRTPVEKTDSRFVLFSFVLVFNDLHLCFVFFGRFYWRSFVICHCVLLFRTAVMAELALTGEPCTLVMGWRKRETFHEYLPTFPKRPECFAKYHFHPLRPWKSPSPHDWDHLKPDSGLWEYLAAFENQICWIFFNQWLMCLWVVVFLTFTEIMMQTGSRSPGAPVWYPPGHAAATCSIIFTPDVLVELPKWREKPFIWTLLLFNMLTLCTNTFYDNMIPDMTSPLRVGLRRQKEK